MGREFHGIAFGDGKFGIALSGDGRLQPVRMYRTLDGGESWGTLSSPILSAISFVDADTGTAVGGFGMILHTTTGRE
jgi:photosystem II stability/assembly factor-like uncharacterized protein